MGFITRAHITRRTYDATLAELTSLEEMTRIMMEEGHVHSDVIARLWKVYSKISYITPRKDSLIDCQTRLYTGSDKNLPQPQRRGAILILGMLALAKRNVLDKHVDTLLKVGLGPLGKVCLTTAFYPKESEAN